MASTIKIKNSSTAGAAPTTSDLVQGELAVNVTDKKIYTKNASGTIVNLGTTPSITDNGNAEAIVIDSSENVGLGVSPSSWGSGWSAFQVGGNGSLFAEKTAGASKLVALTQNAYHNGTNNIYISSDLASRYRQGSGAHIWETAASGTAGNAISFTQAMTLDASGNLLVGTTATDSGAKTRIVYGSGSNGLQLKDSADTSNTAFVIFQNGSNSNIGTISRDGTNNSLSIGTVSAITFPATQVASSNANTLDDYEEGSFTLTLSDSAGNNATMGAGNTWRYIKIGRTVTIAGTLVWTSTSALTAGSRIRLNGLPFTSDGSSNAIRSPCAVGSSEPSSFNIVTSAIKFGLDPGVSYIWGTNVTGNNVDGAMYKADLGNSGVLYGIFVTYLATA